MDFALIKSGAPLLPPAEEHLRSCVRCQKLLSALNAPELGEEPSADLLREIEEHIQQDLRPVQPLNPFGMRIELMGIFGAAAVASATIPGALGLRFLSPLKSATILIVCAAAAFLLADSLVRLVTPGSRQWLKALLVPGLSIALLAFALAALFRFQREPDFVENGWSCFRLGAPAGILAAAPFWLVLRRGVFLRPLAAGAAMGTLAGLVGATMLEIRCPDIVVWHRLAAHLGVAVVGALTGLLGGAITEIERRA